MRKRVVTEYDQAVSDCWDCGAEVRPTLPDGREPTRYGPQLQTEIVLGKIEERLPYRKHKERLGWEGIPNCPATLQAVVGNARETLKDEGRRSSSDSGPLPGSTPTSRPTGSMAGRWGSGSSAPKRTSCW